MREKQNKKIFFLVVPILLINGCFFDQLKRPCDSLNPACYDKPIESTTSPLDLIGGWFKGAAGYSARAAARVAAQKAAQETARKSAQAAAEVAAARADQALILQIRANLAAAETQALNNAWRQAQIDVVEQAPAIISENKVLIEALSSESGRAQLVRTVTRQQLQRILGETQALRNHFVELTSYARQNAAGTLTEAAELMQEGFRSTNNLEMLLRIFLQTTGN